MALNFKNLNVASLDYSDIVRSLKNFLKQEPSLADLDFNNEASAVSLLCDILATGAAYNGIYAQLGYKESFLSTANLLQSVVGNAANRSVLLSVKESASTSVNISLTGITLEAFTPFDAVTPDGSNIFFYNLEDIVGPTSASTTLYSGSNASEYTQWDFNTQSITLPLTVDPRTIKMYSVNPSGDVFVWTRVEKSQVSLAVSESGSYNYFVKNTVNGYLVSANLPENYDIPYEDTVYIRAVESNGNQGNGATIIPPTGVTFLTTPNPQNGFNEISVGFAKSRVIFDDNSQKRCVTLRDYLDAILASGIEGTDDESAITVQPNSIPCTVKVYVNNLSLANQTKLMEYLAARAVAGITLIYSQ